MIEKILMLMSCILVMVVHVHSFDTKSVIKNLNKTYALSMPFQYDESENESSTGWRLIGTHHLTSQLDSTRKNHIWVITMRDTIIYNSDGNVTVRKSTYASSGWNKGLASIDSSVYTAGILSESYVTVYERYSSGSWKYKLTYNQQDDGRVHERYEYQWNSDWIDWEPFDKYIYYYSVPTKMNKNSNFTNFIKNEQFYYDTTDMSWKFDNSVSVVKTESNDTTIVTVKRLPDSTGNLIDYERTIYTFKNQDLSTENRSTEISQEYDSKTGTMNNYSKIIYSDIGLDEYYFDSTGNNFDGKYFYYQLKDKYGNDTLTLEGNCEAFPKCDTGLIDRYERKYDTFGNNIETLQHHWSFVSGEWHSNSKVVNFFEKIPTEANQKARRIEAPNVKVKRITTGFLFTTPGITSVKCYTMSGRLVFSVKKNAPVSSLEVHSSDFQTGDGLYVIELHCGKGIASFTAFIK